MGSRCFRIGGTSLASAANPLVSVIIPAWNEASVLPECLESVFASSYRNLDVIVVDNGSTDGTSELLAQRFPQVRVLRNPENIGFGGALNQGTAAAKGEILLWLNADASLEPHWMESMLRSFVQQPRLGMTTSVVTYRDVPNLIWSAGGCIDGLTGLTWDNGKGEDLSTLSLPSDPDYVAACALLVRREAFEEAGGLDPGYFIYFEDADLGLRLKAAGYDATVAGEIPIHHGALRRTGLRGVAGKKLFIFARSNLRFILKNWPLSRMPVALLSWLTFYLAVAIAKGPSSYLPSVARAVAWNLRHLEDTKAARRRNSPLRLPRARMKDLYRFLVKMAHHPELFPY